MRDVGAIIWLLFVWVAFILHSGLSWGCVVKDQASFTWEACWYEIHLGITEVGPWFWLELCWFKCQLYRICRNQSGIEISCILWLKGKSVYFKWRKIHCLICVWSFRSPWLCTLDCSWLLLFTESMVCQRFVCKHMSALCSQMLLANSWITIPSKFMRLFCWTFESQRICFHVFHGSMPIEHSDRMKARSMSKISWWF